MVEQTTKTEEAHFENLYPYLYNACATISWEACDEDRLTVIEGKACTLCRDGFLNGSCEY